MLNQNVGKFYKFSEYSLPIISLGDILEGHLY